VSVSQSNRHLNATDGDVGRSRLRSVADDGTGPVALAATVVVPTAPSRLAATAPAAPVVETHSSAGAVHAGPESPSGEVDWSKEPLPPNWERKLPKGTSRVSHLYSNFFASITNEPP
jgi:hypothetical protein